VILSLGSINADFLVRADELPAGPGSSLARDLLRTAGGKGANVAVLVARLEMPARLLGCVGDDDLAEQALAGPCTAGVDLSGVRRRPGPTGYASVVVPPGGAKTIVLAPGANDAWADEADAVAADVRAAQEGTVLVVSLEVPAEVVTSALRAARERGFVTVLDPAPPDRLDESLLELVDHLTPDHSEAAELTGIETSDEVGAAKAAEAMRERGVATAHVKLAAGGCVVASDDGTTVVRAPEVKPVDATGAGDAFAGALAWALHEGRDAVDAARVAVAASTIAVTAYGSQESYPSPDDLAVMVERVQVER
jgi:ribokinase